MSILFCIFVLDIRKALIREPKNNSNNEQTNFQND